MKRLSAGAVATAVLAGGAVAGLGSGTAMADTRCTYSSITINSGAGAEPPSGALGHSHNTGRHYISAFWSNGLWDYFADNNGGSNGDTADTYYGSRWC